jgi:hypothetical protein
MQPHVPQAYLQPAVLLLPLLPLVLPIYTAVQSCSYTGSKCNIA